MTKRIALHGLVISLACLSMSGCFNGSGKNIAINLGDVSIGQQLIDLDKARAAEVISEQEYEAMREDFIALLANTKQIALQESRDEAAKEIEVEEDEDGFSWL